MERKRKKRRIIGKRGSKEIIEREREREGVGEGYCLTVRELV